MVLAKGWEARILTLAFAKGWYGAGGGRAVQDWEHMYTRGGFMLMYGKTNTKTKKKKIGSTKKFKDMKKYLFMLIKK